ncbi:hypothetical protein [Pseudohongiella acticola]|jgi:hypothetical protein|uniref:hypothetical protein n=1 Tax=Pseudohongiella acticola TaxID=1524254 RepID=UPI0030EEBBBD
MNNKYSLALVFMIGFPLGCAAQEYTSVNGGFDTKAELDEILLSANDYALPSFDSLAEFGEDVTGILVGHMLFGNFSELQKERSLTGSFNLRASIGSLYIGYVESYSRYCQDYLPSDSSVITTTTTERTVNGYGRVLSERDPYVSKVLAAHPQLSERYMAYKTRGVGLFPGRHKPEGDILSDRLVDHRDISRLFEFENCNSMAVVQLGENIYRYSHELPPIQLSDKFLLSLNFDLKTLNDAPPDNATMENILGEWRYNGSKVLEIERDASFVLRDRTDGEISDIGTWSYATGERKLRLIGSKPEGRQSWVEYEFLVPEDFDSTKTYEGRQSLRALDNTGKLVTIREMYSSMSKN